MSTAALRLLCLAAAAACAAAADVGECGGLLEAAEGAVVYRRDQIAAGTSCLWDIRVPGATKITISFNDVFLSTSGRACKQWLSITQGHGYERALLTSRSTGNYVICSKRGGKPPGPIEVAGDSASVVLTAAWRSIGTGFSLRYTTADVPAACLQPTTSSLGGAACDVTTEGWTVVQRRTVGDVLFNMPWADYKVGFGDLAGDHWIGLDALNELCPTTRPCQLRVEVTWPGKPWYGMIPPHHHLHVPTQPDGVYTALYERFAVADAANLYRLTVGPFNGKASTAGDSLTGYDGEAFSTVDADHDRWDGVSCSARAGQAGWWFGSCGYGLNGLWAAAESRGLVWVPVTNYNSATGSRMLVRPAF